MHCIVEDSGFTTRWVLVTNMFPSRLWHAPSLWVSDLLFQALGLCVPISRQFGFVLAGVRQGSTLGRGALGRVITLPGGPSPPCRHFDGSMVSLGKLQAVRSSRQNDFLHQWLCMAVCEWRPPLDSWWPQLVPLNTRNTLFLPTPSSYESCFWITCLVKYISASVLQQCIMNHPNLWYICSFSLKHLLRCMYTFFLLHVHGYMYLLSRSSSL